MGSYINAWYRAILSVPSKVRCDTIVGTRPWRPTPLPSKASTGQASMPADRQQQHSSRGSHLGCLRTDREPPLPTTSSRVHKQHKGTAAATSNAQSRAATPTAAWLQLAVHALQAWLLACARHKRKRTLRARGLMHGVCAAEQRERVRARSPLSGTP